MKKVDVIPELLNPSEGWKGQFLVVNEEPGLPVNFDVTAHIVGVKHLEKVDLSNVAPSQGKYDYRQISLGFILGVLLFMMISNAQKFFAYVSRAISKTGRNGNE